MINLITSYFIDKNPERQKEIDECFRRNIEGKLFDSIHILADDLIKPFNGSIFHYIHSRPTFDAFFHFAKPNCWNVICNSDIYFDQTIKLIESRNTNEFIALSRYDIQNDGSAKLLNQRDAQDVWAFYGLPNKRLIAPFYQGIPGCDNALAAIADKAGYALTNPALTIKAYHLHLTNVRNYSTNYRVPEPYKFIYPHK